MALSAYGVIYNGGQADGTGCHGKPEENEEMKTPRRNIVMIMFEPVISPKLEETKREEGNFPLTTRDIFAHLLETLVVHDQ